jgi:hypothetical protein
LSFYCDSGTFWRYRCTGAFEFGTSVQGLLFWGGIALIFIIILIFISSDKLGKLLYIDLNPMNRFSDEDWIIDRVSCEQGEKVRITITNLNKNEYISFTEGSLVCKIRSQSDNFVMLPIEAKEDIVIPPLGNCSWL